MLGIRIIKGFGRHRSQARAFRELSGTLRGTELRKARLLACDLGRHHHPARAGDRRRPGARHDPGRRRRAVGRHPRRLPVHRAGAALARRVDRLPARDEQRGGDGHRPLLRGDGRATGVLARDRTPPVRDAGRPPPRRDAPPVASDRQAATAGPAGAHRAAAPSQEGGLRLHGVVFRYPDAAGDAPPVLDGVDLHIRPGETMALVGATGSGKTTLTALVPRLHEATVGPDHAGRRGHHRHAARGAARTGRRRLRGAHPLLRHRRGERPDGRPGLRGPGRSWTAGAGRRAGRLRRTPCPRGPRPRSASRA